jgi:hypothetical protein
MNVAEQRFLSDMYILHTHINGPAYTVYEIKIK